jgi:hypothetical protein
MDIENNYSSVFSYLAENFLKPQIRRNNKHIKYKQKTTFVGLHVPENLKLGINVNNVSSKFNKSYYVMQSFEGITSVNIVSHM